MPAGLINHQHRALLRVDASSRAKVAKASVIAGTVTVGNKHHQLWPVLGRTKP
jgi:hypothetical protein